MAMMSHRRRTALADCATESPLRVRAKGTAGRTVSPPLQAAPVVLEVADGVEIGRDGDHLDVAGHGAGLTGLRGRGEEHDRPRALRGHHLFGDPPDRPDV